MTLENVTASYQSRENYYVRKGLTPLPEPHITGMKLLADVTLDSAPVVVTDVAVTCVSNSVTHKAWSGYTVTLTTSSSHGFSIGRKILVSGVGTPYDGTFEIETVPSSTTFTYKISSIATVPVTTTLVSPNGSVISSSVTLTTETDHGLRADQKIIVNYLTGNAAIANGTWVIASNTIDTITYTVPDISASGTYTGLKGSVITRMTLNTIDEGGVVWVCTDITGWWTPAEPEFPEVTKAFGDGTYDASGRFLARILTLEGSILCPSPDYTPAARDYFSESVNLVYKGAWLKTTERQIGTSYLSITSSQISNGVLTFKCPGHSYSVGETVYIASASVSKSVTGTSGGTTVTCNNTTGLFVGASISGTGIASGTLVTAISFNPASADNARTTITLSKALTATISASTATVTIPRFTRTFEICSVNTSTHNNETFSVYLDEDDVLDTDTSPSETFSRYSVNPLTGTVTTGEIIKASFVRLSGQPEIASATARGRLDFSVGLQAADPIKYQWADTYDGTQQVRFIPKNVDTSATGIQSITNSGNYPVGMTLEITGPVTGPMRVINQSTDKTLIISGGLDGTSVNFVVVEKELVDGVATLRTEGPHGRRKGTSINVTDVDDVAEDYYDGNYTISKVPTDTRISYDKPLDISKNITAFVLGKTVNISTTSSSGYIATYNTSADHGYTVGMEVTISGVSNSNYNGVFDIYEVIDSNTFTCVIGSSGLSGSTGGSATAAGFATVTSTGHGLSTGTLITVQDVDRAVNVDNAEIIAVDTNTISYYATRTRVVEKVTFDNTTSNASKDSYTIYTKDYHGYRETDSIRLFGCGRPFNTTSSSITTATITKVNQKDKSFTFLRDTFSRNISTVQVAATSNGYRVLVETSAAHAFLSGDTVNMYVQVKETDTFPTGLNGDRTIIRVDGTNFYYNVIRQPLSSVREKDYFGAVIAAVDDPLAYTTIPIKTSGPKVNYADIVEKKINKSSGGSVSNTSTIASENKKGIAEVLSLPRTAVTGGSATVAVDPEVLTIDTGKRSVTLDSDAEYGMAKIDPSGDWVTLAAGANSIKIIDKGDATSEASIVIKYRSGWLS